jgi:hypothetical protein
MGHPFFRVVFVLALHAEIAAETRPNHHVVSTLTLQHCVSAVHRVARRVLPIWTSIVSLFVWLVAGVGLFREKSTAGWLLVVGLF